MRGVAVSDGFHLDAASCRCLNPHLGHLSRRLVALGCCLPRIQMRRLSQCLTFGAQSHGLFTRCLRFAASFLVAQSYGHARLASRWWSALAGWDWRPTRSLMKFPSIYI